MTLEMNPEIRARWAAALRSGDYKQDRGYLRTEDGFCCLGVLCDLAAKDGVVTARRVTDEECWEYDAAYSLLPPSVQRWAGLNSEGPEVGYHDAGYQEWAELTHLNDESRWSFAQIADAIDGGAS